MPQLLLHGNINIHTFTNTIVVANEKAKELFGKTLDKIFVIHSSASEEKLADKDVRLQCREQLEKHGIEFYNIDGKVIELHVDESKPNRVSIDKFVEHIEFLFNGVGVDKSDEWIVDLTNGTSVQKNLLSICSYILDIKHQYMINIAILGNLTQDRGFLPIELLLKSYEAAPDSTLMDSFAYLDLSEMVRYKRVIESHKAKFNRVVQKKVDDVFFQENLVHAVKLKLEGDKKKDNALARIATTSFAASIEELISEMIGEKESALTLGQKLGVVANRIDKIQPLSFDKEFLVLFNKFMLHLRNSTTHKSKDLSVIEKFKADLMLKMSFPFMEYYSDIVRPILAEYMPKDKVKQPKHIEKITDTAFAPTEDYFYGLDGDDTGGMLEGMFLDEESSETRFHDMSKKVSSAIIKISKTIEQLGGKVIFNAGDDLLFKGRFSYNELLAMQTTYSKLTSGYTCSIGFGKTLQETYLAMKIAKATPGKNAIVGIVLQKSS
ncbi:MAG TPA: mCpol domain-containing protein [Saprospiraceae bacterium]|nr:mCpol domain-containing protein [Saprospiraceae bacterium]